jgi:hypothetical protein
MALAACGLIAIGCGDDESTTTDAASTTTSSTASSDASASAEQRIDAAVGKCTAEAQNLGEAAASGLEAACTTVGDNVKQALAAGGDQVEAALAQTADSCKSAVSGLPAGDAQDALTALCAAIEAG